jgi:aryl-alcohol dehydrogenase-like predicted oxidoreductase
MKQRQFGSTDLQVSIVGFGGWAIGGPAMAGSQPIGWGIVDDATSARALTESYDRGITFYDTADVYGFGHSEDLIGRAFGNKKDVVIATKVGHRQEPDGELALDYSRDYIIRSCEQSLRRLRRECIDYYQLHSARVKHLQQGDCVEAMEELQRNGMIRYWGLSLNTFAPTPEAEHMIHRNLGNGFQLVLNILNQRAVSLLGRMRKAGYGVIVRMPLQFGLLTGKFNAATTFGKNDHRTFRFTPEVLAAAIPLLEHAWVVADRMRISKTSLALSFCASFSEVSTVIPGIKTPEQAQEDTSGIVDLTTEDRQALMSLFGSHFHAVVDLMEKQG